MKNDSKPSFGPKTDDDRRTLFGEPIECETIRTNFRDWQNELATIRRREVTLESAIPVLERRLAEAQNWLNRVSVAANMPGIPPAVSSALDDWARGGRGRLPRRARRPGPGTAATTAVDVLGALGRSRLREATEEVLRVGESLNTARNNLTEIQSRRRRITANMQRSGRRYERLPCRLELPLVATEP